MKSLNRRDPVDTTLYMGSDDRWHYFYRAQLGHHVSYKVARSALLAEAPKPLGYYGSGEPDCMGEITFKGGLWRYTYGLRDLARSRREEEPPPPLP